MAKTNRNRKLYLNEAWKHYWTVLFPGGSGWDVDLEAEIRKRLYFPGEESGFVSGKEPKLQPPQWASDLAIRFHDNVIEVEFQDTTFGSFPLFTDQLIPALGNWTNKNPFEKANRLSDLTERDQEACRDFVIAVVRRCGNNVQNQLLRVIKEAARPKFDIYCRPGGDVFGGEKRLPVIGLAEISRINVDKSELQDGLGLPKFSFVQIMRRTPSTSKAGPHGSFQEQDAILVGEMKELIDQGIVRSVLQAAMRLLPEADRRATSSDESVTRRLQDAFSAKYPNYTNRAGQRTSKSH